MVVCKLGTFSKVGKQGPLQSRKRDCNSLCKYTLIQLNTYSRNRNTARRCARSLPATEDNLTSDPLQPSTSVPKNSDTGQFWDWKFNTKINYIHKGSDERAPAILMVHGFGVGSFHFSRNIDQLGENFRVWAVDLVGQGRSLPENERVERLALSIDAWTEQLSDFVEEVVGGPVYVVGNSLGGYLAVCLSAKRPELCKGVILLNATPFWGFGPNPETDPFMSRIMPYNGSIPAPKVLSWIVKTFWFRFLKRKSNVKSILNLVYSDKQSVDDDLIEGIVEASEHPMAVDSFTSIIFSPRSQLSFNQMVEMIKPPVCMLYGRDDPWVVPLWGQRLKRLLPKADYYELTPCGHCPHHETPKSVNFVIQKWVEGVENGEGGPLNLGQQMQILEGESRVITIQHIVGAPRNLFEKWDNWVYHLFYRGKDGLGESKVVQQ
eukprot:TRINITY_DN5177_c4_g1_i1.p1 TRINITY_DN5177_c4_g1~~TRINITY_DN5177_c4_g1_i1.p1  ORF type:complete len:479 (+),score=45.89 TRINITY_DN5177_c4_g1_i1:136-1437(+)